MNKYFGIIGLLSTFFGFLFKAVYRDYIYSQEIDDFGLANMAPSFFYVLGFSQLLLVKPTKNPIVIVGLVMSASIAYEFMQYGSTKLLDYPDIIASVAGGICSILIIYFHRNNCFKVKSNSL